MKRYLVPLLLAASCSLSAQAAFFQNGSFEAGNYSGDYNFDTLSSGNGNIAGWVVSTGSIDWINNYWQHADGQRSIDLNGSNYGGISQTFDTTFGQTYVVRFDLAGNTDGGSTLKSVNVSAGNFSGLFQFNSAGQSRPNMGWQGNSFSFVAQGASTTLLFQSPTTDGNVYWGAALDNVSVAPVPEPETYALIGIGLLSLLARRAKYRI